MASLQDIFNLAKIDGSKFFVIDEKGEPKLVIMSVEDYQALLLEKMKLGADDIELINREIIQAQLKEEIIPISHSSSQNFPVQRPPIPQVQEQSVSQSKSTHAYVDMREEVIDPSFDFEGPKFNLDDL